MADNLKVRVGRLALGVVPGVDADGVPRQFVASDRFAGPRAFPEFKWAARIAGKVLDTNPDVVAQVRTLPGPTGCFAKYGVSVARRTAVGR